jgi:hypothetical protein
MATGNSRSRRAASSHRGGRGAAVNAANADAASAGVAGNVLAAEILPDHAADILETDKHEMDVATQKDYRRRQKEIIGWMKENYPEQYNHCVVELSPDQMADPKLKYFTSTHEFIYENVNFAIIKGLFQLWVVVPAAFLDIFLVVVFPSSVLSTR